MIRGKLQALAFGLLAGWGLSMMCMRAFMMEDAPTRPPTVTTSPVTQPAVKQPESSIPHKHDFESTPVLPTKSHPAHDPHVLAERRAHIKTTVKQAWDAYRKYAWGTDELDALHGHGSAWVQDPNVRMNVQIIDALDTLWLVGLRSEYNEGLQKLVSDFKFAPRTGVSLFETTIRVLGGLLSAYALTDNTKLLDMARTVGEQFLPAYSGGRMPGQLYNPSRGTSDYGYNLADVGSVQLEHAYLSLATHDDKYRAATSALYKTFEEHSLENGLIGAQVNTWSEITTGANADSYYEYLIKVHLLTGDKQTERMYRKAAHSIVKHMVVPVNNGSMARLIHGRWDKEAGRMSNARGSDMGHLSCFIPGTLVLGVRYLSMSESDRNATMIAAKQVMRYCMEFYRLTPYFLAAERVGMDANEQTYVSHVAGLLRPETVESLFYLHRQTKDPQYREWAWQIYTAMVQSARVCPDCEVSGFTDFRDAVRGERSHGQPTWLLAETLKYMHLIMSDDDVINLDCWVFNTEAHPFPTKCRTPVYTGAGPAIPAAPFVHPMREVGRSASARA